MPHGHRTYPKRPRPIRAAILTVLAATAAILGMLTATPATANVADRSGPHVLTKTSWYGITLGASMTRVAQAHGWDTGSCGGPGPDWVAVPRSYHVAVAGGIPGGRVAFIEVWPGGHVRGPGGIRSNMKLTALQRLLSHGVRHQVGDGVHPDTWTYWVIPMKGHYLYVRSGNSNGTGTRDRVSTFGLAINRAVANSRGQTMGGCY